jgi:hypothetical protein
VQHVDFINNQKADFLNKLCVSGAFPRYDIPFLRGV